MKHTPGPWSFERHGYALYVNSGDTLVTALSMDGKRMETSEANARLIAAAPDLLTHLARLVECLDVADDDGAYDQEINAAIAAIAAATQE